MATTDDMEVLAPASTSVAYQGQDIDVAPLAIGTIPAVVRELRPVIAALRSADGGDEQGGVLSVDITPELVMDLIADHSAALFTAVGLCVDRPAEVIGKGNSAEFVALVIKVVEVNRDFFIAQILPLLGGLATKFRGAGQTPSSS